MTEEQLFNTMRARIYLNNVWNVLAPKADEGFVNLLVKEMTEDGTTDVRKQCITIVGRLYDGLKYGNWPSAICPKASDQL